jgi:hypothetical protein
MAGNPTLPKNREESDVRSGTSEKAGHPPNADGKTILVMDLVGSRNLRLNLHLAWAGVKTGPYVRKRRMLPLKA